MIRSKPKVYSRRARPDDCDLLALNARPDDVREMAAVAAVSVKDGALFALRSSEFARSVFLGKALVCMYGVSHEAVLTGGRTPWMLGTRLVDQNAARFLRLSRIELSRLVAKYGALENMVDARSLRTVRWLKFLGFTVYDAAPYGIAGRPFHRFRIEPSCALPQSP